MDIHRCRFVDYSPSAINALAFSHTTGSAGRNQPLRLAIGRANGDIEIWDPRRGAWIHETTLRGGKDRSVEGLAWTQDPDEEDENGYVTHGRLRLFSIGYSSAVTEWDLNTGLPLRHSTGNHSEVWCLAAQPRWRKREHAGAATDSNGDAAEFRGQHLVAGCADGTIVLLSTSDEGLTFQRYIARASKRNARALSLAFQDRNTVVVGFADSTIRVYDIRSGKLLRTMSLGGGVQGGLKERLVWAVECLRDGTVVSGDSTGEVTFWDGKTYGQLQRLKSHEADVLCLTASEDGETVFSGGMDTRTVVYQCSGGVNERKRWAPISKRSFHRHDVKAMARFENSKMSVVVSGGLDTHPILIPLRDFGEENFRHLPYTPQSAPVGSTGRLVVSWWNQELTIWQIDRRGHDTSHADFTEPRPNHRVVAQLDFKGDENISDASVSPNGSLLVVATSAETKVFHLKTRSDEQKELLKIRKLEIPETLGLIGARLVRFSPDSQWLLIVGVDSAVYLWRVASTTSADLNPTFLSTPSVLPRLHRTPDLQNCLNGTWGSYDRTINRVAFSSDSRILAASDLNGNIDTWILEGNEDTAAPAVDIASRESSRNPADDNMDSDSDDEERSERRTVIIYGQHWTRNPLAHMLPRLPSSPIILSFRPSATSNRTQGHPKVNGNPAVHATRHNPHAHSHSLPLDSEDRLFVVTASHELYEFEVLKGRLSDWSRRNNGANLLPEEFRLQRERAVGCVWDVFSDVDSKPRQRVWLHGATWLCMFDLDQDFRRRVTSSDSTAEVVNGMTNGTSHKDDNLKKRKRDKRSTSPTNIKADLESKRNTSGLAGSRVSTMPLSERVKVRILDKDGNVNWVKADSKSLSSKRRIYDEEDESVDESSDEDFEVGNDDANMDYGRRKNALGQLRRAVQQTNAEIDGKTNGEVSRVNGIREDGALGTSFWITNRYRPILGVVPLTDGGFADENKGEDMDEEEILPGQMEVALIERPFWDLNLPPRFELGRKGR